MNFMRHLIALSHVSENISELFGVHFYTNCAVLNEIVEL